ncbi:hypothetical protein E2C01_095035 [Portunus trituberculatus]|uniref:Uncharacterized protein n=1 Tax=Portunus trituberculatus TaxID=210409 RepID=A0A5B7JXR6_PORTR|nr:hypothetical protein [Portunus trituberculatus]
MDSPAVVLQPPVFVVWPLTGTLSGSLRLQPRWRFPDGRFMDAMQHLSLILRVTSSCPNRVVRDHQRLTASQEGGQRGTRPSSGGGRTC